MTKRRKRKPPLPGLTASEALEMAEMMSDGEAAQMAIAADILGVSYDEFLDRLLDEQMNGNRP